MLVSALTPQRRAAVFSEMFSERSRIEHAPNELALARARREAEGHVAWDLTSSNPTQSGVSDATVSLSPIFGRANFDYEPEALGQKTAREAIAAHWAARGVETSPERIVVTSSTSEAYSYAFRLLCEPGDEVLVPAPSYPLFEHLARHDGVRVARYQLVYEDAWRIDWDSVERACSAKSRAIVVVNPNNPTGNFLRREDLVRLVHSLGLPVICDEVFGLYHFGERRPPSVLELHRQETPEQGLVIALDGLSKSCAMPQVKLAWMTVAGNASLVAEAMHRLEYLSDAYLSASTIAQSVVAQLFAAGATTRSLLRERLARNLEVLRKMISGTAVSLLEPEGGWYASLRLPAVLDEVTWVLRLLEEASVLVHPGFFYDFQTEPYLVVSLIGEPPAFKEGIARLVEVVTRVCEPG